MNIYDTRTGNLDMLEGKEGGYTTTHVEAPNTNRQFSTDEYTGIMDGTDSGKGYLTNDKQVPNTNRQFSTKEYTGTADSNNSAPMSYSDIYNMTLNDVKEKLTVGREQLGSNVTIAAGKSFINQENKKMERINNRDNNTNKIYSNNQYLAPCSVTKNRKLVDDGNNEIIKRIEPSTLNAFNNNPYTKSLQSHIFN